MNVRGVVVVALAGALLAGCGVTSAAPPASDGQGYASLVPSVTLSALACEPLAWCIAAGTNPTSTVRPASIEVSAGGAGRWAPVATPPITGATLGAASCWTSGCLLGGSGPSGTLLVLVNPSRKVASVTSAHPPGSGVSALACTAPGRCLALVTGPTSTAVFATTDSGGAWTQRSTLPPGLAVATAISCANGADCVAVGTGPHGAAVARSVDGGVRWVAEPAPAGFETLTSVSCGSAVVCLATARRPTGPSALLESTDAERTWRALSTSVATPLAVTCAMVPTCVVAGGSPSAGAISSGVRTTSEQALTLSYVPDPVLAVACATPAKCTAITTASTVSFTVPS